LIEVDDRPFQSKDRRRKRQKQERAERELFSETRRPCGYKKDRTDGRSTEGKIKMCQHSHAFRSYFSYLSCQQFFPLLAANEVTN